CFADSLTNSLLIAVRVKLSGVTKTVLLLQFLSAPSRTSREKQGITDNAGRICFNRAAERWAIGTVVYRFKLITVSRTVHQPDDEVCMKRSSTLCLNHPVVCFDRTE
ncbi:hypothetical protein PHMEG_00040682, partial [Phytophthora megakarya]